MEYDIVIVRYGEIFLKSDYVRRSFTNRLAQNIRHALDSEGVDGKVSVSHHRLYISSAEAERAGKRAAKVFGVQSTSPAVKSPSELPSLTAKALECAGKEVGEGSFAVRVSRSRDYPINSQTLERTIGGAIRGMYGSRVDLTEPDTTIGLEVQPDGAMIFSKTYAGVGGLPYGTQGSVAAEVSDARGALASWMMMRRGCRLMLVDRGGFADQLSYFANPCVKTVKSLEDALFAGAEAIVSPSSVDDMDLRGGVKSTTFWPLIGLDDADIDRMRACAGL